MAAAGTDELVARGRAAGLAELPWPDGPFLWAERFWPAAQADRLLAALEQEAAWSRHRVRLFGRTHLAPRLSAWHGDAGARYRYSGSWHEPQPWTPALAAVRDALRDALGTAFNAVLANRYRDGNDAMGWHRDDEAELGPNPVIASASFGATRRFLLRHRDGRREVLALGHGSLLVMAGASQACWRHALPRTARPVAARVNLTFRQVAAVAPGAAGD